jgi:hypothetical protein
MSEAIATIVKMMESLPETRQEQVVDHLREYLLDLQDELRWDESFKRTQSKLGEVANQVRKDIAEGKTEPMDYSKL